jgi:hypothetical protein
MKTPTNEEYELIEKEIFKIDTKDLVEWITIYLTIVQAIVSLSICSIPEKAAGGVVMMRDNNYKIDEGIKGEIIIKDPELKHFLEEEFNDRQNKRQDIID